MVESQASPVRALPRFDISDYADFLQALRDAGWSFGLVRDMATDPRSHLAFMRHDVDFHLTGIEAIAEAEADHGVRSTWYVLLTGPYNPMSGPSGRVLRRLVDLGHDIGLHYDLSIYPTDPAEAEERLHWAAGTLATLVGEPVRTICMHQPGLGGTDPFLELEPYVHPHGPHFQSEMLYVSDSCRAWRDHSILSALGADAPQRLLLNTHAELWLDGSISDRLEYLERVVRRNIADEQLSYVDHEVRPLWQTHPGGLQHDCREGLERHDDRQRR